MNYDATLDLTQEWTSAEEIRTHLNLATYGWCYVTELGDFAGDRAQSATVYVLDNTNALYAGHMCLRLHKTLDECIRDLAGLVGL